MAKPTPEQAKQLVAHFGSQPKAAEACGVCKNTIQNWLRPDLQRGYNRRAYSRDAERRLAKAEVRTQRLLDKGLCVDCGREPPITRRHCWDCRDRRRNADFKRYWGVDLSTEDDGTRLRPLPDVER